MMPILFSLLFGVFALMPSAQAQELTTRFEGRLLERGTKTPLAGLNIFALPAKIKATSGGDGRFVLENVPRGSVVLVVNGSGFLRLDRVERAEADVQKITLFLEREKYAGLETTVVGKVAKRDDSTRTLMAADFLTQPGSGGDPVKAVQNLPGIARTSGVSSQIVIQGSAPQDTRYLLEDVDVPLVFHFGGLTSIVTPEAVESVDYLAAGYGPEYGGAMGGVIGLKLRDPATDRLKGFVFADTTKSGGLLEGPINDKSSFLVSARYSYIGFLLKLVLQDNASLDLTVAPSFADVSGIYKLKVNERDDFRLVTVGSRDELQFILKEPVREDPSLRGNFRTETDFWRIIPEWTRRLDENHRLKGLLAIGQDVVQVDVSENYFDLSVYTVGLRGEYETKLTDIWRSYFGLDTNYGHAKVNLRLPALVDGGGVRSPISSGESVDVAINRDEIVVGPYWRNEIRAEGSPWVWMPSARFDYFSPTHEFKSQPRLAARYEVDESLRIKAATGLYYQLPEPQETAVDYGNPELTSPYALHYTVGVDKDFRGLSTDGWSTQSNLFYRDFKNLVVSSSRIVERSGSLQTERYSNEGTGRAYGAEALIRYDQKPWAVWLAYTLSRSLRTEPNQGEHIFRYDQTHNVNVNGSIDFKENWKLGVRARYVTGNPVTPVIGGTFDADNDTYVPRRGPFYSERLNGFFQIDARLDKKWVYDTYIVSAYLDVQNLTNQQNPEGIRYSYDYSQTAVVSGLPILPTIGARGEF